AELVALLVRQQPGLVAFGARGPAHARTDSTDGVGTGVPPPLGLSTEAGGLVAAGNRRVGAEAAFVAPPGSLHRTRYGLMALPKAPTVLFGTRGHTRPPGVPCLGPGGSHYGAVRTCGLAGGPALAFLARPAHGFR